MAHITKVIVSAEGKRGQFSNQNGMSLMATIELDPHDDPMALIEGWHRVFQGYIDVSLEQWAPPIAEPLPPKNGGGRW